LSVLADNVDMNNKVIKFYTDEKNVQPYIEWVESLDKSYQARISLRMERVKDGNYGNYRNLGNGIYELKFKFGAGYRVYFGEDGNTIVLLLSGGDKSTQITDIKKAIYYWKDYINKKGDI
jgi:putative addiction module killer protein